MHPVGRVDARRAALARRWRRRDALRLQRALTHLFTNAENINMRAMWSAISVAEFVVTSLVLQRRRCMDRAIVQQPAAMSPRVRYVIARPAGSAGAR